MLSVVWKEKQDNEVARADGEKKVMKKDNLNDRLASATPVLSHGSWMRHQARRGLAR